MASRWQGLGGTGRDGHLSRVLGWAQQPWDGTWGRHSQGDPSVRGIRTRQETKSSVGTPGEAVGWWQGPGHGRQLPWGFSSVSCDDCAHIPSPHQGKLFKVLFSGSFPWKFLEHLLKHITGD